MSALENEWNNPSQIKSKIELIVFGSSIMDTCSRSNSTTALSSAKLSKSESAASCWKLHFLHVIDLHNNCARLKR